MNEMICFKDEIMNEIKKKNCGIKPPIKFSTVVPILSAT